MSQKMKVRGKTRTEQKTLRQYLIITFIARNNQSSTFLNDLEKFFRVSNFIFKII